jgi:hypothetical protein
MPASSHQAFSPSRYMMAWGNGHSNDESVHKNSEGHGEA